MSVAILRKPETNEAQCKTNGSGRKIETISEYLSHLETKNSLIELGLNTVNKRLRGIDAIVEAKHALEAIDNLDNLKLARKAIKEIDTIANETTSDEIDEPVGEEILRLLSSNTYCERCGRENEIRWVRCGDNLEEKRVVIECTDSLCLVASIFGMSPADYLAKWEKEQEEHRIERAEARARQFNRATTEIDYVIERLYDDYLESPVTEATETDELEEGYKKFYGAYDKLVEQGGDCVELAHIFDEELGAISCELMRDYFERGFHEGMKYQAQISTTEKEGVIHEYSSVA
jgi:hypothetical protein